MRDGDDGSPAAGAGGRGSSDPVTARTAQAGGQDETLRVFTFSADWGLPTTGPFALKLLAWLRLSGIAYAQSFEDRSGKGPLGKSPWIEWRGERIGDSGAIIAVLAEAFGVPVDPAAPPAGHEGERGLALARALATAFEERFHQVLEWELFVHPAGAAYIDAPVRRQLPRPLAAPVASQMKRHFARQLHARGIGRHPPEKILALGRAEVETLAMAVDGRAFLCGKRPGLADLCVFGQVMPMLAWPMRTPVADALKATPAVAAWAERIRALAFGGG
jgi:glutathione S-transferase